MGMKEAETGSRRMWQAHVANAICLRYRHMPEHTKDKKRGAMAGSRRMWHRPHAFHLLKVSA